MILNMPNKKKKEENITIDDDEILGDILGKIKPKVINNDISYKQHILIKYICICFLILTMKGGNWGRKSGKNTKLSNSFDIICIVYLCKDKF